MLYLSFIVFLLIILFSVMFVTLLERKIIGYSQTRMGPNKVSMIGVIQPALDGVKLLVKEFLLFFFSNSFIYLLGPVIVMGLMIFFWFLLPVVFMINMKFFLMVILCLFGVSVYSTMISGWSSFSKYSVLGGVRSVVQTISYEINISVFLFCYFYILNSFSSLSLINDKFKGFLFLLFFPFWSVLLLMELNRAPLDFSEGESELVSGFNTEYSSGGFALLFIGEYGFILVLSIFTAMIFFDYVAFPFIFMFILFIRCCFPRFRYDLMLYVCWLKILPFVLFCLLLVLFY